MVAVTGSSGSMERSWSIRKGALGKLMSVFIAALGSIGITPVEKWPIFASIMVCGVVLVLILGTIYRKRSRIRHPVYGDLVGETKLTSEKWVARIVTRLVLNENLIGIEQFDTPEIPDEVWPEVDIAHRVARTRQ